ncbi:MAG TPA: Rieske 2Fe-2S domain-containing protein [Burkholderiaceae bacterium]|nr:Rieske 2Fe-2S domain-containing protein [Burkholderiaceae bacterium]
MDDSKPNVKWIRAIDTAQLQQRGRAVVKLDGKQLALFAVGDRVFACNNRCPHEGYPLAEGHLAGPASDQCVLTCNWHNWKFELATGHNVYGGDALRMYPTRLADGAVWVDIAEAPQDQRVRQAYERLHHAMDENQYDRVAREVARLAKAGADPRGAVARAIVWSHGRLRDGMTHAYAAANGWLRLHEMLRDPVERLTCLAESVGHIAYDTLREADWPYCADQQPWSDARFAAAIEAQDEDAALAHYNDFGHSLIYLRACGDLIERLGADVQAPLLLAYVRSLVRATREDLIPEFRKYAEVLSRWATTAPERATAPDPNAWVGLSINRALDAALAVRGVAPLDLFHSLLGAASINLLRFDPMHEERTEGTVADNVGWLDFTHAITFANAVRLTCSRLPDLWPAALLQMALFVGRNSPYLGEEVGDWRVHDVAAFDALLRARVLNHGVGLYIHSAHLLKTWLAARDEMAAGLPANVSETLAASVNRYLSARVHQKRTLRTARQALDFVTLED